MCVRNIVKISSFLAVGAVLGACGAMDTILPSTGTYKVSAQVNGLNIDDCSIISSKDKIRPFFDESVSDDPDVKALVVFLRDSMGEITGVKVTYVLDENYIDAGEESDLIEDTIDEDFDDTKEKKESQDDNLAKKENENEKIDDTLKEVPVKDVSKKEIYKIGDELVFSVKSLDKNLPFYPLPSDLPMDRYTIVYQIMGGKQILQKTEKTFFYLADTVFSFENIQVHLPTAAENALLIPKGAVIMLEAKLECDSNLLDPYIVWYNGKSIISEGLFAEGAGKILWKAPDQSGFFSLRAEVFPVLDRQGLAGYFKDISLLISSKTPDMRLTSQDIPGLMYSYLFEGDLNDSKSINSAEGAALRPGVRTSLEWMPSDGIYGLAAGAGAFYTLPEVSFSNEEINNWRILFRFKPINKGDIFSVQFGTSFNVAMKLSIEDKNLVLTLASPMNTVSQRYELLQMDQFINAEIDFSTQPDQLLAKLNVMEDFAVQRGLAVKQISLEVEIDNVYQITLGSQNNAVPNDEKDGKAAQKPAFTVLWDEFALFNLPLMDEIIEAAVEDELPETEELVESDDESALEI
jgi:hypothetical protein